MSLRTISGSYIPSFFTIHVKTDELPENYKKSDEIMATILHEYIHYIQDVSTIYGIQNFSKTVAEISGFYNLQSANITLPYKYGMHSAENPIQNENQLLFDILFGHNEDDYKKEIPNIEYEVIVTKEYALDYGLEKYSKELYLPIITFNNRGQKNFSSKFGASAIMEGMAHIFEKHFFPNSNTAPLVYHLPLIIANHFYPEIVQNDALLFALCDVSLMHLAPGVFFIAILDKMKENRFMPANAMEIYNYAFKYFNIEKQTVFEFYSDKITEVIKDINNVVNITEAENAKTWAVDSVIFYYIKRKENFAFLAEMLECGLAEGRTKIYELLQNRTSPVIKNNQNIFSVLGKPLPPDTTGLNNFYWYNLSLMYEYIFFISNVCPFSMYCTEKNRCGKIEKPYSNNDKKCIFDQFSRITGLYKKNIIT